MRFLCLPLAKHMNFCLTLGNYKYERDLMRLASGRRIGWRRRRRSKYLAKSCGFS